MDLHVTFHHLVNVKGLNRASSSHADGVAQERPALVVPHKFWVFRKNGAFLGGVAVGLQSHHAFLASSVEQLCHHFQGFQILGLAKTRAAQGSENSRQDFLENMDGGRDQDRAYGRSADDDQLDRLQQHFQVAMFHQIASTDGTRNHHDADNHKHRETSDHS